MSGPDPKEYELYIFNFHDTLTTYYPEVMCTNDIIGDDQVLRLEAQEIARELKKGNTDLVNKLWHGNILKGFPVKKLAAKYGPGGTGGMGGHTFYECIPEYKRVVLRELAKDHKLAGLSTGGDDIGNMTLGKDKHLLKVRRFNEQLQEDGRYNGLVQKYTRKNKEPYILELCRIFGALPEETLCVGKDRWDGCPGVDLKIVINGDIDTDAYKNGTDIIRNPVPIGERSKFLKDLRYAQNFSPRVLRANREALEYEGNASILPIFNELVEPVPA